MQDKNIFSSEMEHVKDSEGIWYQTQEDLDSRQEKENNLLKHLSPQETQVYQRLMLGLTEQSIANTLKLKRGTIKTIKKRIGDKIKDHYKINLA